MKKLISMTLCIAMVLSLIVMPVSAAEGDEGYIAKAWFGSSDNGKRTVSPNAWTGYNLMSLTDPVVLDANLIANGYVQVKVTTESGAPTVLQLRLNVSPNVESTTTKADILVDMLQYDSTLASDIGVEKVINIPLKDFKTESGTLVEKLLTNAAYGALEGADGKLKITTTKFKGNSTATAVIAFSGLTFWDKEPVVETPEEDTETDTDTSSKYIASAWFGSSDTGIRYADNGWGASNLMSLTNPIVLDAALIDSGYVQVNVTADAISGTPTTLRVMLVVSGNVDTPPATAAVWADMMLFDSTLITDIGKEKLLYIPLTAFATDSGTKLSALLANTSYGAAEGANGKMKITSTQFKGHMQNAGERATLSFQVVRFWNARPGITVSNQNPNSMDISWDTITGAGGYKVYKDGTLVNELTNGNSMKITGLTPGTKSTIDVNTIGSNGKERRLYSEAIEPIDLKMYEAGMTEWQNVTISRNASNTGWSNWTYNNRYGLNVWMAGVWNASNKIVLTSTDTTYNITPALLDDTVLTFFTRKLDDANKANNFLIELAYNYNTSTTLTMGATVHLTNLFDSSTNPRVDPYPTGTGSGEAGSGWTLVSIPLSEFKPVTSLANVKFDWSKVNMILLSAVGGSGGLKAGIDEFRITAKNPYIKNTQLLDEEKNTLSSTGGILSKATKFVKVQFSRNVDIDSLNNIKLTTDGTDNYIESFSYDVSSDTAVFTLKDILPYGKKVKFDIPNTVVSAKSVGLYADTAVGGKEYLSVENSGYNPVQAYSVEYTVDGTLEDALSNACIVDSTGAPQTTYTDTITVCGSVDLAYSGATAKGIFAIYNADGSLKDIKFVDITATTEAGKKTTEAVILSNGETASFFVWDGLKGLDPIINGAHIGAAQ